MFGGVILNMRDCIEVSMGFDYGIDKRVIMVLKGGLYGVGEIFCSGGGGVVLGWEDLWMWNCWGGFVV